MPVPCLPRSRSTLPRLVECRVRAELVDGSGPRTSTIPTPRARAAPCAGAATAARRVVEYSSIQACWPVAWQPVPRLRSVRPRITVSFQSHLYSAGAGAGAGMEIGSIFPTSAGYDYVHRRQRNHRGALHLHGSRLHSCSQRDQAGGSGQCSVPNCQCSLQRRRRTRQQQQASPAHGRRSTVLYYRTTRQGR